MKINILFFSIWLFWCFNFLVDILHCIYTIFKILSAVLALSVCMIQVFLSNLLFFEKFSSFQQSVYFILQSLNISILKVNWHFNTAFSQNVIFGRFLALVSQISQESTAWKSVQIQSFFWSVFSHIQTEYGEIIRISPYSVRMRENTDQKKLHIWILFTQWSVELLPRNFQHLFIVQYGTVWSIFELIKYMEKF